MCVRSEPSHTCATLNRQRTACRELVRYGEKADRRRARQAGLQAARTLLLVPEAPPIALLLVLYLALAQPPLLGRSRGVADYCFIARCLALIGARASHAAARYREAEVLSQIAL